MVVRIEDLPPDLREEVRALDVDGDGVLTEQDLQELASVHKEERRLWIVAGILVCIIAVAAVDHVSTVQGAPFLPSLSRAAAPRPVVLEQREHEWQAPRGHARERRQHPPVPASSSLSKLDMGALAGDFAARFNQELAKRQPNAPKQACDIPACQGSSSAISLSYPFAIVCLTCQKIVFVTLGGTPVENYWVESKDTLAFILTEQSDAELFSNEVGNITNLNWLVLSNSVHGTIPTVIGNLGQLAFLHMQSNALSGTIPTEFGLLTSLSSMTMTECGLGGELDDQVFLSKALKYCDLSQNAFTGTIPAELVRRGLEFLSFAFNSLEGPIPTQFGLMVNMTAFDFWHNRLEGAIPTQFGLLTELTKLELGGNADLSGPIPTQVAVLPKLQHLSLYGSQVNGTIPSELGLLTTLQHLDLSNSQLTGPIPSWLGGLSQLTWLDLHTNQLTAAIPSQLGLLSSLVFLRLAHNTLEGTLPTQLAALSLLTFDISYNSLSGSIPEGVDTDTLVCEGAGLSDAQCVLPATDDKQFLDTTTFYSVCGVAGFSLFVSAVLVIFVVAYRSSNAVLSSGLWFALVTLGGAMLVAVSVVPYGIGQLDRAHSERRDACRVFVSLFSHGVVLVLSAVFARNYGIMRRDENNKLPPTIKQVRLVVGTVALNVAIATPVSADTNPKTEFGCDFNNSPFLYIQFVLVAVLAVAACYTSFKIRHVESSHQDTQSVAKATYTILTFGLAMMVLSYTTSDPRSQFLSLSLSVLLCAITFVLVVHGPKVVRILKGQDKEGNEDSKHFGATAMWSNSHSKPVSGVSGSSAL